MHTYLKLPSKGSHTVKQKDIKKKVIILNTIIRSHKAYHLRIHYSKYPSIYLLQYLYSQLYKVDQVPTASVHTHKSSVDVYCSKLNKDFH